VPQQAYNEPGGGRGILVEARGKRGAMGGTVTVARCWFLASISLDTSLSRALSLSTLKEGNFGAGRGSYHGFTLTGSTGRNEGDPMLRPPRHKYTRRSAGVMGACAHTPGRGRGAAPSYAAPPRLNPNHVCRHLLVHLDHLLGRWRMPQK
jgi:hypothetical protein